MAGCMMTKCACVPKCACVHFDPGWMYADEVRMCPLRSSLDVCSILPGWMCEDEVCTCAEFIGDERFPTVDSQASKPPPPQKKEKKEKKTEKEGREGCSWQEPLLREREVSGSIPAGASATRKRHLSPCLGSGRSRNQFPTQRAQTPLQTCARHMRSWGTHSHTSAHRQQTSSK